MSNRNVTSEVGPLSEYMAQKATRLKDELGSCPFWRLRKRRDLQARIASAPFTGSLFKAAENEEPLEPLLSLWLR